MTRFSDYNRCGALPPLPVKREAPAWHYDDMLSKIKSSRGVRRPSRSDSTGEPSKKCSDDSRVCPDKSTLANVKTVSMWAEGAAGTVAMDIKEISAVGCAPAALELAAASSDVPLVSLDGASTTKSDGTGPVTATQSAGASHSRTLVPSCSVWRCRESSIVCYRCVLTP